MRSRAAITQDNHASLMLMTGEQKPNSTSAKSILQRHGQRGSEMMPGIPRWLKRVIDGVAFVIFAPLIFIMLIALIDGVMRAMWICRPGPETDGNE